MKKLTGKERLNEIDKENLRIGNLSMFKSSWSDE